MYKTGTVGPLQDISQFYFRKDCGQQRKQIFESPYVIFVAMYIQNCLTFCFLFFVSCSVRSFCSFQDVAAGTFVAQSFISMAARNGLLLLEMLVQQLLKDSSQPIRDEGFTSHRLWKPARVSVRYFLLTQLLIWKVMTGSDMSETILQPSNA